MVRDSNIVPVILCGGSGTRLWPMSRKSLPKQFIPLAGDRSFLHATLLRARALAEQPALCIAAEEHRFLVDASVREAGGQARILLEPATRNTAAAICLACLDTDGDDILVIMPADHYIPDAEAFARTMQAGVDAAKQDRLVAFGVFPAFPSTSYGYLVTEPQTDPAAVRRVLRFAEKPSRDVAQSMILEGNSYWNSGIYVGRARVLIEAFAQHAPDVLLACQEAMRQPQRDGAFVRPDADRFKACRSDSIDYAVMEHTDKLLLVPFNGAWSDVGSWDSAAELIEPDSHGNRASGNHRVVDASNTTVWATSRLVVALGTRDLSIIETPDAVLVAAAGHSEQVKAVVAALEADNVPEVAAHRKISRPWGWYDTIDAGEQFLVKRIMVRPGASLSLQKHHHRAEHWVVVKGVAEVTRGEECFPLQANESTYIPIGVVHRLHNPGEGELEMIEIQTGDHLSEDDIVRFEDNYGRK
ncbi:capsular polysaccharide biosynthesis mannose-6-phosphate isomerase/mannose-1-phosphate guanylyl transferase [Bordetella ansorpii]|uniref:mannose-1-phosphate guanylyltransferase n=1 Tax=Bordetella ansorpii TaxID=288768 RepID=A0A157R1G9_9BORD|nr:mannose-1-phosphate guanylyltransferase/mannose-6-phosphate isomerase [Bordetella ansorpii]SAI51800.1 capsular polysaccharide biosynthesis mannose-6-phosphate isomerase/mannose-1-phosphate guanylyl transferase [Bordetella ansorpii]